MFDLFLGNFLTFENWFRYVYQRSIEKFVNIADFIYQSIDLLINHINGHISELVVNNRALTDTLHLLEKVNQSHSTVRKLVDCVANSSQYSNNDDSKSRVFQSFKSTVENVISPGILLKH